MKFNALIPELSVIDIEVTKDFYMQILDFKLEYERVEEKFIFLSYGEAQIMFEQINGHWETGKLNYPFGRGINFQITTDDIELLFNRLISNGYKLFREPYEASYRENEFLYNEKEFLVQDPDGYLLRFSQEI